MAGFARRLSSGIAERLASTWVLLSDTTNFLSRTSVFDQYEAQLKDLRYRLSASERDNQAIKRIRDELVELRASLRLQGYDLSLGALELSVKGFRNDASLAEGFRRMVLFIGSRGLWYVTGEENHIALSERLDSECDSRRVSDIRQRHYLWYRWSSGQLMISGADSETAEDFEQLKAWASVPENKLALLGKLKGRR